jgi:hypothetical protein
MSAVLTENGSGEATTLKWVVRLGDRQPGRRWVVIAVACAAGIAGQLIFRHPLMAILGFGVILLSTAEMLLPLHHRLDEHGASVRCGLSESAIDWKDVKRARVNEEGIKLSPLDGSARMEAFRGVYLRFADNRDSVLNLVQRYWGNDVSAMG